MTSNDLSGPLDLGAARKWLEIQGIHTACSPLGKSCSFLGTPSLAWKGLHLAGGGWVKLGISRCSQHPPV